MGLSIKHSYLHLVLAVTIGLVMSVVAGALRAETYYVDNTGSDINDGRSEMSPFKTIKYAAGKLQAGDSLLLKAGDVFYETSKIVVKVNNVRIGSYGAGVRPIIHGNSFRYPGGVYDGLITVGESSGANGNGVLIENIELKQSSGMGIVIYGDDVTVRKVFINQSFLSGIVAYEISYGLIVEDSEVYNHNWAHGPSQAYKNFEICSECWGKGIVTKGGGFIFRNNKVHEGWGEGMGATCGGYEGIIEGNTVISNKVGIYLDNVRDIKVLDNTVDGGADKIYWRGSIPGQGIGINNEPFCGRKAEEAGRASGNSNVLIQGNNVKNASVGLFVWAEVDSKLFDQLTISCNSVSDNDFQFQAIHAPVRNMSVSNNSFTSIQNASAQMVKSFNLDSGFVFSNNIWSSKPQISAVLGAGDIYGSVLQVHQDCAVKDGLVSPAPPANFSVE